MQKLNSLDLKKPMIINDIYSFANLVLQSFPPEKSSNFKLECSELYAVD